MINGFHMYIQIYKLENSNYFALFFVCDVARNIQEKRFRKLKFAGKKSKFYFIEFSFKVI